METRYDHGGDEFVYVEIDAAMSLPAHFTSLAITRQLAAEAIDGVEEICPSNASYMVRVDPDRIHPRDLVRELQRIESEVGAGDDDFTVETRIVDVPIMLNDPWTHEVLMRFRDRHQDPTGTDLDYGARINGYDSTDAFVDALASSPYLVTMMGFVPGLPWCFQLVPRERQVEVPKYVRPRTETPERAFGFGGAFAVIYPVKGAGGYQLFGSAPAPIFDAAMEQPDFAEQDSVVFFRHGDVINFRRVDEAGYDEVREQVADKQWRYRTAPVEFSPRRFLDDPDGTNAAMLEGLYS
ncbi:5-oxoprolinase subunit B family protein [Actinomycetospora termitidis]|uniref:Carboxyltransferase domain-containing protein n=1 Tax=Actinomycetospora termitidis TaxID=3053470 RepID=A0ABT7MER0_9PSEU|nr:carboxyltransferase domain-containing protein [Actinomycetospora sp. Odt1-22]MDL5157858.1 carboxyltransferase domain-containing protein [Actinomycetospora sp. Odt1-22]